jgi:cell division protein FtsL
MTPTALTPAGRGTRPKPRHGDAKRQPAAPGRAATAAQGARTATQGARTAAQGARTAAEGTRTAVKGARTAAHGTRAMAQGARTAAQGARTAAEGARTVARSVRTPVASGPAGGRGTGHRAPVRRPTAPRNPRRVSGPARPARRRPSDQRVVRAPLAARSAGFIRALPDHVLLDRIIRGRCWIPLLGVLLVGIVAMQVEVLKLNAGIGRALEQSTSLQNRNEQLRAAVARQADDQRIESIAAHMGMVMPQPAAVRFLHHDPIADVGKAVSSIHAPDGTAFQAALTAAPSTTAASNGATTGGTTASTAATTAGTSSTGATTSSTPSTTSGAVTTPSSTSSTSPGA